MILPGNTIGVLGGGQLGRMLAQAAKRLGYRMHVYEPAAKCPAGAVADKEVNAPYEDLAALTAFAKECAVVTYEFENVPAAPLQVIEKVTQLLPHWRVLETAQNRSREKRWLREHGIPHAHFAEVAAGGDLAAAIRGVGLPCVVKTADFGYDGKGQLKVMAEAEVAAAVAKFRSQPVVVEQFIPFACEVSAVVARSAGGEVLVNELAPRTHNSGHYTLDACATSQFEQQVRAICGQPLGDTALLSPVVMVNILGDAWAKGEPRWDVLQSDPAVHLHLYGKSEARPGRKMGHFTVQAAEAETALAKARDLKAKL